MLSLTYEQAMKVLKANQKHIMDNQKKCGVCDTIITLYGLHYKSPNDPAASGLLMGATAHYVEKYDVKF